MRIKSMWINNYKNLHDFKIDLEGGTFIDIFVGKNGTGKSNFFEALIEVFRYLYELDRAAELPNFDFSLTYEIEGKDVTISHENGKLSIDGRVRKTVSYSILPDNIVVYYSGHNGSIDSLVERYEQSFKRRLKRASSEDSRFFIGIGPNYKDILLAVLLLQRSSNKARSVLLQKLGINAVAPEVKLVLKRPFYANKPEYDIDYSDGARYWRPEGITKEFLDILSECISLAQGGAVRAEGYFASDDRYIIYCSVDKLQNHLDPFDAQYLFRMFDNLKTIGMLFDISLAITMKDGNEASISQFSDGQFQSIYIYSIMEIFKNSNCITVLDEPDSFLHPEWQHEFLKQVGEISEVVARRNHILMSSHSAVTLISHESPLVRYFDIVNNRVKSYQLPKKVAIRKLSSDLIRYSEQDQLLSIINIIQIQNKPVLFTEGSVDPIILKEAWFRLYECEMPFNPLYAFSCSYLCQLLTDARIHHEMKGLPVFGLFDFDKAYDYWNGMAGEKLQLDPFRGLVKKWASGESYALMLPVSKHPDIQKQVVKSRGSWEHFGGESLCEIEHLFYGLPSTQDYFETEPCSGGQRIRFKSDSAKTNFAREVIPLLDSSSFEIFRPMFDFIQDKCSRA